MNNAEAIAYAGLAMKNLKMDRQQVDNMIAEMVSLFDELTEEEALRKWLDSPSIW